MADNNNKNKKYKCTCFLCGNIPDFLLSTNEETAKYLLKQISFLLWCDYCVEDVQSHDPRIGLCRICKAKIDYSYNFVTLLRTKFPLYKENIKRISVSPPTSLIDQPVKVRRLELPEETETEDSYRPIEVKVEIDDYHMYDQAYVNECNSINTENENKNDKNSQETDTDCLQHIVKIENCESENEAISDVVGTKAKNDEPQPKKPRVQYDRSNLQKAIDATRGGMSAYRASKLFSVPASTIRDKVKGRTVTKFNATVGHNTIFTKQEEKKLHDHIIYMADIGCGYSKKSIQCMAKDFAASLGKTLKNEQSSLSDNWFYGFTNRWPDLKTVKPQ
ncbi:hypothetical protein ACF0H5_002065 [Mactra antiquata]